MFTFIDVSYHVNILYRFFFRGGGAKLSWMTSKILLVRGKNFVVERSSLNHTLIQMVYKWHTLPFKP